MSDPTSFLDGRVTLHCGDCLDVLAAMPDCSVDSVVTDPPYALVSIAKRFGKPGSAPAKEGKTGAYARASRGFMGKQWDTGERAFAVEFWEEVWRVLKPGGHVLAFSGTRTYHRMVCAIEDAGFEIRDQIGWAYGSGFPKSHDVSKAIDKRGPDGQAPFAEFAAHYEDRRKAKGLTHAAICEVGHWYGSVNHGGSSVNWANGYGMPTSDQWAILQPLLGLDERWSERVERVQYEREVLGIKHGTKLAVAPGQENDRGVTGIELTAPGSGAAFEWKGWGTALKPAWEPIVVARKAFSGSVADNVLAHGTGALNIDACRIHADDAKGYEYRVKRTAPGATQNATGRTKFDDGTTFAGKTQDGRWPANLIHDGSDEVLEAFPETASGSGEKSNRTSGWYEGGALQAIRGESVGGDSGSAARFFYTAKADADDRIGSKHPTVKPVDLMQYLCRLVTPPGGTILDPFAGTGTTGEAAWREGFKAILIEREAEYQADIARRMDLAVKPTKRAAVAKSKNKLMGAEGTPLFGGEAA